MLPYRVHALDYIAGELDGPAYGRLSCFRQVAGDRCGHSLRISGSGTGAEKAAIGIVFMRPCRSRTSAEGFFE